MFAEMIMYAQLIKEQEAEETASKNNEPYIILCDRSIIEPAAYIGIDNLSIMLAQYGKDFNQTRDSYNLVIHLTTAAKDAGEFYTTQNNTARTESVIQAIEIDNNILQIWSNHPNRVIITNSEHSFDKKIEHIKEAISKHLHNIDLINSQDREDR